MEYRMMNNSKTSLLGFGCMRFPMKDGEVDVKEAERMVDYAVSKGVNYIDTAYPYHDKKSELIVRDIMKKYDRKSYYLADKLPLWECKSLDDVKRIFQEQLDKCGVTYFDFYLVHAVNEERLKQTIDLEVMELLTEYKEQGLIKNIGFSFHDELECFKKWVDLYDWDFCQIQLNYMDIDHQQGLTGYEILTSKNIPVIIMEPIKGGSLAKFSDEIEAPLKVYNKDASIASWAFRWVGSLPNVKCILSGMSTMEQVVDNINTFTNFKPFNESEYAIIDQTRISINKAVKNDCTGCNYCMDCPHGVDIPFNFKVYNMYSMYKNDGQLNWALDKMNKEESFADLCISCNICVPKCPQNIDIPSDLEKFKESIKK